jgi:8-oxo-dGTP pyrophosphatase MutT (NUDIX family)
VTSRHPDLELLARRLAARPGRTADAGPEARRAAVAVMIRDVQGSLEVLLIKRAEYQSDPWSGHVALPGGRMEPQDATLAETAARETLEEIGIDIRDAGVFLGTLDEVHPRTPVLPPVVVRPFVVAIEKEVRPVPSHEVADVFWVPLRLMSAPSSWQPTTIQVRGVDREVLCYRHESYVVWGLTERVLQSLLTLLRAEPPIDRA